MAWTIRTFSDSANKRKAKTTRPSSPPTSCTSLASTPGFCVPIGDSLKRLWTSCSSLCTKHTKVFRYWSLTLRREDIPEISLDFRTWRVIHSSRLPKSARGNLSRSRLEKLSLLLTNFWAISVPSFAICNLSRYKDPKWPPFSKNCFKKAVFQVQTFYEAVGHMIASCNSSQQVNFLMISPFTVKNVDNPDKKWQKVVGILKKDEISVHFRSHMRLLSSAICTKLF